MGFEIIRGNIVKERTDAIVTPASREKRIGRGLDKVIHKAAGPRLLADRIAFGDIAPGFIGETPAYGLGATTGARYILHTIGPRWSENAKANCRLILELTYLKALLKARSLGCGTVSFPLISSGHMGMPVETAMDCAVSAIESYLAADKTMNVKLVGIDTDFFRYAKMAYRQYVVEPKMTDEEESAYRRSHPRPSVEEEMSRMTTTETLPYYREFMFAKIADMPLGKALREIWTDVKAAAKEGKSALPGRPALKTNEDLAAEADMTSKSIRNCMGGIRGQGNIPGKDKLIAICLALNLEERFVKILLAKGNYSLDPRDPRDKLIKDYLDRHSGNIFELKALVKERFPDKPLETQDKK